MWGLRLGRDILMGEGHIGVMRIKLKPATGLQTFSKSEGTWAGAEACTRGGPPSTLTLAQLLGFLGSLFFLGQALVAMLVYVWSRRSPQVRVNFFGLLTFQAPFLPWALMGFSLLLGNSILVDLLGEPTFLPRPPQAGCSTRALPPTCTGPPQLLFLPSQHL